MNAVIESSLTGKPRILLVDDEPNVCRAIVRLLRDEPLEFFTAASAEEAISIINQHSVDAVISDENMGGMRGTHFLAWLKQAHPHVVRILLTGQPTEATAVRATYEGKVDYFLTKPVSQIVLLQAVEASLGNRRTVVR